MATSNTTSRSTTLMLVGLLAVGASLGGLVIWPNYVQARSLRGKSAELQFKIAGLDAQHRYVNHLAQQVATMRRRINHELRVIPESPDVAGLIRKLSIPIDRATVLEQTFTAGAPTDAAPGSKSTVLSMPLTIDMEATFESIFALLRSAESIDRLVRIGSLRVSCQHDEEQMKYGPPLVKATVGLEAVFDPQIPMETR